MVLLKFFSCCMPQANLNIETNFASASFRYMPCMLTAQLIKYDFNLIKLSSTCLLIKLINFIRYECGLARKFFSKETRKTYNERWMSCNWNKSWTPSDTLDECVWVQCINPPKVKPLKSYKGCANK